METNRLRLIEVDPARDSIAYNEVIVNSFDSLHPWVSWAEKLPALEDTRRKLDEIHEGRLQGVRAGFGIYLKVCFCRFVKVLFPSVLSFRMAIF